MCPMGFGLCMRSASRDRLPWVDDLDTASPLSTDAYVFLRGGSVEGKDAVAKIFPQHGCDGLGERLPPGWPLWDPSVIQRRTPGGAASCNAVSTAKCAGTVKLAVMPIARARATTLMTSFTKGDRVGFQAPDDRTMEAWSCA